MTITKKIFCGFEPAKMHCEFMYTTNAFQDESWDLSNSKGYEHSFISCFSQNPLYKLIDSFRVLQLH